MPSSRPSPPAETVGKPPAAARAEDPTPPGLNYSTDTKPGITRERTRSGFRYRSAKGTLVRDRELLGRIRSLAIPPAWEDVWICTDPRGHIQATGRDARGRKQYRYHSLWRESRDEEKFARMSEFGRALPRIRRRVERDLARPGLSQDKVLATVVRLLETTFIRIGSEEYARTNRSFGLTTLRGRHATVKGSRLRFQFRGKSGRLHQIGVRDRRLARVVARCQDLPGQDLFQYLDDEGEPRPIRSDDVNAYLREASGTDLTAKDFRTWMGTLLAFRALRSAAPGSARAARSTVKLSAEKVAEALGNTAAVSRKSYIAPSVVDAYLAGELPRALVRASETTDQLQPGTTRREELALVRLLEAAAAG